AGAGDVAAHHRLPVHDVRVRGAGRVPVGAAGVEHGRTGRGGGGLVADDGQRRVADADAAGGTARGGRVLSRYQRDRLALVAHQALGEHGLVGDVEAVAGGGGQVAVGQHSPHAGDGQRAGDV